MPTAGEIEGRLFRAAPKELAMDWDNVGLLVGDPAQEIRKVLVALDITEAVAEEAAGKGCELIVAHHPVMNCRWRPVQTIRSDTPQGRLLIRLIRDGIGALCLHTDLDIAEGGVNDLLAEALGLIDPVPLPGSDGVCRMGRLPGPVPLERFARDVCAALHCGGLRYVDGGRPASLAAVGGGACGEYAEAAHAAGCDTFVTADLKYHGFLDAAAMGLSLIDAGHFPTEDLVCGKLVSLLREAFPGLSVERSAVHRDPIRYLMPPSGTGTRSTV